MTRKNFLYTQGSVGGSEELKNLLRFMECSVRDNAVDDELEKIMDIVDIIKSNPEERKRYMGLMGVIEYERRDAYEEGLIQGIILGGKSNGAGREKVKSDICRQFSCDADKAEEYMKRYWDDSVEKSK